MKNNLCFKFDINQIPYYEMLNGETVQKSILNKYNGEKLKVITLFGENISALNHEQYIELLSLSQSEFSAFKTEKRVFLHIADIQKNKEFLFEATVEQVGKIEQDKSYIDFIGEKRFSKIGLSDISYLEKPTKITHELLKDINYFVTLKIKEQFTEFSIFEFPNIKSIKIWENDDTNSYLNLMNIPQKNDVYIDVAQDFFSFPELRNINILEKGTDNLRLLDDIKQRIEEMKDFAERQFILTDNKGYFKSSLHTLKKITMNDRIVVR